MRERFDVPQGTYLLSHSVGALPKVAQQQFQQAYLEPWRHSGGDAWPQWLQGIEDFCHALSALLGSQPDAFCPQSNLSSGLTKYLLSLQIDGQRNRVLMHEDAFPSMGFVVQALEQRGIAFEYIPRQHPADDPDSWQSRIDDTTLAVLFTHVHSNTGIASPIPDLVPLAHAKGALALVDIAQSAGIMSIDLNAWGADAVFGSCVKWLCGGPGAGFLWLNPESAQKLSPNDVGWFSHENPFEFDIHSLKLRGDAKQHWGGTPTVAPFVMAAASIRLITEIGVEKIFHHNRKLMSALLPSMMPLLAKAPDLARSGGTLCAHIDSGRCDDLYHALNDANVRIDRRGDTLRMSFHIYNTEQEVEQLTALISAL